MRKTKIICTIGPACENVGTLKEMMKAGMNVARFNFSHGTHEEQQRKLELVKQARKELDTTVATMLDTKGPEIRLIDIQGGSATLKEGNEFILTTEEILGTEKRVSITYKNLVHDLKPGDTVLIDDGLIELCVEKVESTEIHCKVVHGGPISNHKGVNVPGVHLTMPYVSDVDRDDVIFGCKLGFDFLAASFVRCKEDILELRKILEEHDSHMQIIAKIENMEGIHNLDEIIEVSDGIMVARGDMGVEIPFSEVPILQKRMIKKVVMAGKHVITATQMLESMIHNPRPTRAEATDVANAFMMERPVLCFPEKALQVSIPWRLSAPWQSWLNVQSGILTINPVCVVMKPSVATAMTSPSLFPEQCAPLLWKSGQQQFCRLHFPVPQPDRYHVTSRIVKLSVVL